jgi:hypothetical protein
VGRFTDPVSSLVKICTLWGGLLYPYMYSVIKTAISF